MANLGLTLNPKRAVFCYISAGCYFFTLKLHDFFSSSLALNLRPFVKKSLRNRARGPTKNWPKTDFQWKLHTNRVFCFQDTLSLCFILFIWFIWSKNICKHTLTHIIAKKCNFAWKNSEKIAKNHDFGDFWWFSCFWHDVTYDVTVGSYKVCLYFFGKNGLGRVIAIH